MYLECLEVPVFVVVKFAINDIPAHGMLHNVEIIRDLRLGHWILEVFVPIMSE